MSGSGGFYTYRCKFWMTDGHHEMVYLADSVCANCLADGRESIDTVPSQDVCNFPGQIRVPRVSEGSLKYMPMELVPGGPGASWQLREEVNQPP
ncbi:hypothetical protein P8C59_006259 [Phyllachora maydis]|uniref:Uncharacterized protein n=1 Tax=Phyllachora maydis TaxID=1825666 RepID=A0AAD9I5Y7_9PEZI|nr:hypothetical protein P8C59_006259 [Phyllachora maydis]